MTDFAKLPDIEIEYIVPLTQRDNEDRWFIELKAEGVDNKENPNIKNGTCKVSSFAMCLLSEALTLNIPSWQDKFTEKGIEEYYFKEISRYIYKTPEKDDRWQTKPHCDMINLWLKVEKKTQRMVFHNSSIEEIIRVLNTRHGVVLGTWATSFGHIIYVVGYCSKGLKVCDPWGDYTTGYRVKETKITVYPWKTMDVLLGMNPRKGPTFMAYIKE